MLGFLNVLMSLYVMWKCFKAVNGVEMKRFALQQCQKICSVILALNSSLSYSQNVDNAVVNRLYLTFVLYALLKETNIWSVSEKFNMSRGYVQTLLNSAASFASCLLHFCEVLCYKNIKKFFVVWFAKAGVLFSYFRTEYRCGISPFLCKKGSSPFLFYVIFFY